MWLPKVSKLLLIFCDSVKSSPDDFVSFTRSLPKSEISLN